MKLLLDQGTPRLAAEILRQAGIDVLHTGELGMAQSSDEDILRRGSAEGRIVVTLDADFHALLALSGATKPSVVRLRVEGLKAQELAALVLKVMQLCREDLEQGAVVSIQESRVRVRRLPIN